MKPSQNHPESPTLGILLPTLNCRGLLAKQVEIINTYGSLVKQIVVVDSHSTDGTLDFLKESLHHPNLHFISAPPGLYQSWNLGIKNLATDYVLIATAGDTASREDVAHLLETARTLRADVVISPPDIVNPDALPHPDQWPIHHIVRELQISEPMIVAPHQIEQWTARYGKASESILGSSAGNLYRTDVLRRHPFPTHASFAGDLVWGILHLHALRVAITPRSCSQFLVHPKPPGRPLHLHRIVFCAMAAKYGTPWETSENLWETMTAYGHLTGPRNYYREQYPTLRWFWPKYWKTLIHLMRLWFKIRRSMREYDTHPDASELCGFLAAKEMRESPNLHLSQCPLP